MALPPQFLEELRLRTPLPGLIGRRTRLVRNGRQWKGCCPFHNEKTPSFYVYDDHFHCFGCGAHGDAIEFLRRSEGAEFMEAVERLAAEAGMQVPQPTPQAAAREARARDLHGVLALAQAAFARRLRLPEGRPALDYLLKRGLTEASIERFGLGWSGEGRGALAADLKGEGVTTAQLVEAGLMKWREPDDPASGAVDLYFNRVMFPIRDRRGRVISFGGRILGDGQPKYVNGPETDLFRKRMSLYGVEFAREAAFLGEAIVVVEGYFDVIALNQAGFAGAVAPLGTALTEDQLNIVWSVYPEPILCFDGDKAGKAALTKAIEIALPNSTLEKTLRAVSLEDGKDPAEYLQAKTADQFQKLLRSAPLIHEILLMRSVRSVNFQDPNSLAMWQAQHERWAELPKDKNYKKFLRNFFFQGRKIYREKARAESAFRKASRALSSASQKFPGLLTRNSVWLRVPPNIELRRSMTIKERQAEAQLSQYRILLGILMNNYALIDEKYEELQNLTPEHLSLDLMIARDIIDLWVNFDASRRPSFASLFEQEGQLPVYLSIIRYKASPESGRRAVSLAEADADFWHFALLLHSEKDLVEQCRQAMDDFIINSTDENQKLLIALTTALAAKRRGDGWGMDD